MNTKKIIRIFLMCGSFILVIAGISVGVFAYKNKITTFEEAKIYAESIFNAEKNEVFNKLSDYEFNDILTEIKQIESSKNSDTNELSYYHIALADKMSTASKKDVTSAILDKSLSAESRTTIIISAQANNVVLDYERLSAAISDDTYEDIRPLLIELVATATPTNIDAIEKIVDNKTNGFSKAIKTLWEIKPTKADAVADEVLAEYSGEYDEIFRGAFSVKSYKARLDPTDKNSAEFIALCDRILNTPCEDSEDRQIFIIATLEEIQNKQILIYFRDKGFSEWTGGHNIALTLSKILKEPASTNNIELFLHFYPKVFTQSLFEDINSHLANNKTFYNTNTELKTKLESIAKDNYETVSILSSPNEH